MMTVAGACVGMTTGVGARDALAALALFTTASCVVRRGQWRNACLGLVVFAGTAGYATFARGRVLEAPLTTWMIEAERAGTVGPVVVDGRLVRDAQPVDAGARLLVDVDRLVDARGSHDVRGRIQMFVGGEQAGPRVAQWTAGRRVRAPALLGWPPMWFNPGGADARWQVLRRPFDLTGSVKSALLVHVDAGGGYETAPAARAYVRRVVTAAFGAARRESAAIVVAVLIGDRGGLDDDLERRLQAAGTYHVIAISGGNVALLTGWLFFGLRLATRSFRLTVVGTLVGVAAYGAVAGGEASVSRAVFGAALYLACGWFGLVPTALDVLAVVAMGMVLTDPRVTVDVGAWLSFGATFGIILCAHRFMAWLARIRAADVAEPSRTQRAARIGAALLGATLAAELALLPVSAAVFTRVGVAGLVLNFIAAPMMAVVQMTGLLVVLCGSLWPAAAGILAGVAHVAAAAITESARLVDVVPWVSWRVPPPAPLVIVLFYASAGVWLSVPAAGSAGQRRVRAGAMLVAIVAALVIASAPFTSLAAPPRGWLRMTAVDVGQGDATLLQLPTGHALLVDAGGANGRFDIGGRIVTPALWASGVRRLDHLLVTHADLDHIGGAASVVSTFAPREIWDGVPVERARERRALHDVADRQGIGWRQLQRGDRWSLGPVEITVMNPPLPDWERQRVRNDDSVVLCVRYGDVELLLTGDIGEAAEAGLLDGPGGLDGPDARPRLRVLKVAHHGSRTSSSPDFVRAYRPNVAVVSAGRRNPFGHPSPQALERLRAAGATIFRTDRDGATIVETDGRIVRVRAVLGRTWTVALWPPPS